MDKDVVCIYSGIILSHKNKEILPFPATWLKLDIIILNEVSQKEKVRYHMISLICEILKKRILMNLFTKQKQTHRHRKQIYGYKGEKGRGKDKLGVWDK